jgi:hypothetical protein
VFIYKPGANKRTDLTDLYSVYTNYTTLNNDSMINKYVTAITGRQVCRIWSIYLQFLRTIEVCDKPLIPAAKIASFYCSFFCR